MTIQVKARLLPAVCRRYPFIHLGEERQCRAKFLVQVNIRAMKRPMDLLQLAVTWYMLEGKLPTGTSKTKRLHQDKFEFSLFWMPQSAACPPARTM